MRWKLILLMTYLVLPALLNGGIIPAGGDRSGSDGATTSVTKMPKLVEVVDTLSVARPSHLEAVPLNRDGSLNLQFHRELLLGGEDNTVGKLLVEQEKDGLSATENRLKEREATKDSIREMFSKADRNHDGRLDSAELRQQILENVQKHLNDAKSESQNAFQVADANGDGRVTWDEYKTRFVAAKEHINENHPNDRETQVRLEEERYAFEQAEGEKANDESGLDEIEWLSFRHPEHSKVMLREMAEEILAAFDKNKDSRLTVDEFVGAGDSPRPNEVLNDPQLETAYKKARQHEFEAMLDKNGDGVATIEELVEFVDPKNERHIDAEVEEIMHLADSDRDDALLLDELLSKSEFLASSGFVRPKSRLHDDL